MFPLQLQTLILTVMAALSGAFINQAADVSEINHDIASASASSTREEKLEIRSGQYTYNGQTLKYEVKIPVDGGKVVGKFSGVCSGPITGEYNAGPAKVIEGNATVICPILLNKKLSAKYTAHLDLNTGVAYIDWVGNIPSTEGHGSFQMGFAPFN
jgi:hypothetical protein